MRRRYERRGAYAGRDGWDGEVTGIRVRSGETATVMTAAGGAVSVDVVVCCAGRWTSAVAASAGTTPGVDASIPLVPWQKPGDAAAGFVVWVGPVTDPALRTVFHGPAICGRPHGDPPGDTLHLEAPDAAVDLHTPEPERQRWAEEILRRARRYLPGLAAARVLDHRVCVRPLPVRTTDRSQTTGSSPNF